MVHLSHQIRLVGCHGTTPGMIRRQHGPGLARNRRLPQYGNNKTNANRVLPCAAPPCAVVAGLGCESEAIAVAGKSDNTPNNARVWLFIFSVQYMIETLVALFSQCQSSRTTRNYWHEPAFAILFDQTIRGMIASVARRPPAISDGFRFGRKDRNHRRDRFPADP